MARALDGKLNTSLSRSKLCLELATRHVEYAKTQVLHTDAFLRRVRTRLEIYDAALELERAYEWKR